MLANLAFLLFAVLLHDIFTGLTRPSASKDARRKGVVSVNQNSPWAQLKACFGLWSVGNLSS